MPYEPEADAMFARMSPAPDAKAKDDMNAFIKALKPGIWPKFTAGTVTAQDVAGFDAAALAYLAARGLVVQRQFVPPVARLRDRVAFGSYLDQQEIEAAGPVAWLDSILSTPWNASAASVRRSGVAWAPTGFNEADFPSASYSHPKPHAIARVMGRKDALRGMMAEFWLNHLVPGLENNVSAYYPSFRSLHQFFYENALGNFEKLGTRFLRSVPLQHFMTNYLNTASSKNENLGREFLELFFLGIADPDEPPRYDPILDVLSVTDIMTGHGVHLASIGQQVDGDPNERNPYLANQSSGGGVQTFFDNAGVPVAGGSVSFYEPGTMTPKAVYTTNAKTVVKPQPVALDSAGKCVVYGSGKYRCILKDVAGAVVWDADNLTGVYTTSTESFFFNPANHDGDAVTLTFLPGVTFSNADDGAGAAGWNNHPSLTKLIRLTVRHRPSARFICTKIARWFLGIDPRPPTREAMIDTYLANVDADDQIAKTLRVLFLSEDFCTDYCADRRALTPLAWYSKLGAFFTDSLTFNMESLRGYIANEEEYFTGIYATPKGYPDVLEVWLSPGKMSGRGYRSATFTANGTPSGVDWGAKYGISTPRDYLNFVNKYLLGERANTAMLESLGLAFSATTTAGGQAMPLDTPVTDWTQAKCRTAIRNVLAAAVLLDYAHMAV